jgi:hypothetical protein
MNKAVMAYYKTLIWPLPKPIDENSGKASQKKKSLEIFEVNITWS